MKGVFERNPPTPRYSATWDVSLVLHCLKEMSPSGSLPLKDLTLKLCMLLALVTAQRVQTLQLLDLKNLSKGESYRFTFSEHLKQSRPGKKSLVVELTPYITDRRICVVHVLDEYIKKTASLRGEETRLFISHVKPHKRVSRDTIARWLKLVMSKSGIDTSVYKAHSTRAASTSRAARGNLPVEDILKTAGWASAKTFGKFYHKALEENFADAVLQ